MRKIIASLLVLVMVLSLSATALAETVMTGEIGANLRSGPGSSYPIIRKIHQFEYLNVISKTGQWYYVSYGNLRGYVHSGNVTVVNGGVIGQPQPDDYAIQQWYQQVGGTAVEQWAKAGIYGAKLRSEMNINNYFNEVHSVHYDEQVYLYCSFYSNMGELWYYAKTADGYVGYVHAGNIVLSYGGYGW
ncbi:MAG: SH3 domain-containing protein [Clostridiales bacterium]|nr:SH3 domain-containing protein [Clostridiales bacterium]